MVTEAQIGWLAGVMDGEGSISLSRRGDSLQLAVLVNITNCSEELLLVARQIMLDIGVPNPRIDTHDKRRPRPSFRLWISTRRGIKILLEAPLPHLVAKRAQAILMLEYVTRRMSYSRRTPFCQKDQDAHGLMSKLNHGMLDSVETARDPRESAMIQSGLHGDM